MEQSRGTMNRASSESMSNDCSINAASCFDRPTIPSNQVRKYLHTHVKEFGLGRLTHNSEYKSNTDHSNVKKVPDICRIKDRSGITPLAQLVVEESRKPDVEQDLRHADLCRVPFHQHRIVQEEKGNEEDNLEALEVSRDSKTRKRVGCVFVIETGLFLRVNLEF